jgi:hypothetical protein
MSAALLSAIAALLTVAHGLACLPHAGTGVAAHAEHSTVTAADPVPAEHAGARLPTASGRPGPGHLPGSFTPHFGVPNATGRGSDGADTPLPVPASDAVPGAPAVSAGAAVVGIGPEPGGAPGSPDASGDSAPESPAPSAGTGGKQPSAAGPAAGSREPVRTPDDAPCDNPAGCVLQAVPASPAAGGDGSGQAHLPTAFGDPGEDAVTVPPIARERCVRAAMPRHRPLLELVCVSRT